MRFLAPQLRRSIPSLRKPTLRRTLYSTQAEFLTLGPRGSLITRKVAINLGDPHEAFVMVPTEIGHAFRAGIFANGARSLATDPELCPLTFYHETRHFACAMMFRCMFSWLGLSTAAARCSESSPYPRLVIPQELPRQSDAETSPATLYLFGVTHEIVLDGTFDAKFAKHLKDSLRDLKEVLDELKDR